MSINLLQAKKSLFAAMCAVLLSCIGISLPYPILAPYFINESTPLTQFQHWPPKLLLGLVLAIYPLGVLFGSSVIGAASDVWGRKRLLLITLFISAIGYIGSVVAFIYQSFPLLILTRFLTGFCEGNISVAKAIAIDLSPTLDKVRTFSLINATGYAGWLLGPLMGGLLAPLGIEFIFMIAVVITFFALVCIWLLLPTESNAMTKNTSIVRLISKQNSFALLNHGNIKFIFLIYFLATLGLNAYYEFYPLLLSEQYLFSSQKIGIITALLTSFMIITSIYGVSKIKQRFGLFHGSLVGLSLLTLALAFHQVISINFIWPYYAFVGVCIAIFNGFLPVYISEQYSHLGQGQLMGLVTTTFSLANVVIALIGSAISVLDTQWSITFGALLAFISTVLFMTGSTQKKQRNKA